MATLELLAFAIIAITASVVAMDINEALRLITKPRNQVRYRRY
ncbi:MAG: hypothetical protein HMLIMOIP_000177 [Candidatus Nitrosomirales archaeon]|jgi:hypothetical protein